MADEIEINRMLPSDGLDPPHGRDEIEYAAKQYLKGGCEFAIVLIDTEMAAAATESDWPEVYRLHRVKLRIRRRLHGQTASTAQ